MFCLLFGFKDLALSIGMRRSHQLFVQIVSLFFFFCYAYYSYVAFSDGSDSPCRIFSFLFMLKSFSSSFCIISRFLSLISLILHSIWSALSPKLASSFLISFIEFFISRISIWFFFKVSICVVWYSFCLLILFLSSFNCLCFLVLHYFLRAAILISLSFKSHIPMSLILFPGDFFSELLCYLGYSWYFMDSLSV